MVIRVTQEHIDCGVKGNCLGCPIALALQDAGFSNGRAGLGVLRDGNRRLIDTPDGIYRFIRDFDRGQYVEPFEFEIPDAA